MQHEHASAGREPSGTVEPSATARAVADDLAGRGRYAGARPPRCYGIQVLIAGRRKCWRDRVSLQIRQAGYTATTVDCAVDALTVLVLGLPVDVLVTDADLHGDLRCGRLAREARALRPNLGIVFASDRDADGDITNHVPDALPVPSGAEDRVFLTSVRAALDARI